MMWWRRVGAITVFAMAAAVIVGQWLDSDDVQHHAKPVQLAPVLPSLQTDKAKIVKSVDPSTPDQLIAAAPSGCQQTAQLAALSVVRDTGYRWQWAKLTDAGDTWTAQQVVALADDTLCQYVAVITYHEWMHTAGSDELFDFGTLPDMINGQPIYEVTADCGAMILLDRLGSGQDYPRYAAKAGGCTPEINRAARKIINGS